MKLWAIVKKTWKESVRDWKVLSMVLVFSPFFLLLMKMFYGGGPTIYQVGIINEDLGKLANQSIQVMEKKQDENGNKLIHIVSFANLEQLKVSVKEKTIDVGIVFPKTYSTDLRNQKGLVEMYGVTGNIKYPVGAIFSSDAVFGQGLEISKVALPVQIKETFLEKKKATNEFDSYVPGLISLSILMIMFTTTAIIVKEKEKSTLVRLKISRLGSFNYLMGICVVQTFIGMVAMFLSYLVAIGLGYESTGEWWSLVIVGVVSSVSMVAISLIVASFLNTVFDVLTVGCFPFFILMFFSGAMFPLPKMTMFTFCGHGFGITDLLPLTHTANAFNKILNFSVGIEGLGFEIGAISLLSVVYFLIGAILYNKRRLSKA